MSLRPPGQLVDGRRGESDRKAAARTDAYVETMLTSRVAADRTPRFDPEVRAAAELLRRSLVRFHPSFRFEEDLAARLHRAAMQADAPGDVVPFPLVLPGQPHAPGPEAAAAIFSSRISFQSIWPAERLDLGRALERADLGRAVSRLEVGRTVERIDVAGTVERIPRQVLMGGAIASGVSLAGVAFAAWRWGHRSTGSAGPARPGER